MNNLPFLIPNFRNITEELQSIHKKDREEMQLKIKEMNKERENLKSQFAAKEEELKLLVQKAEKDTVEVRDVYENMLAEIKNGLGKTDDNALYWKVYSLVFNSSL